MIEWNAKCKEHFWLPPDAEVDFDRFYSLIHDDDRDEVRAAIDAAVDGARRLRRRVPHGLAATAAQRWIRAKGRVYRDASGEPTRFDGVTLDISRQKQLEDEREALLAAERQARVEAERASRMKDEFLATLSHELRTPLSAILGWTHLLGRPNAAAVDVAKAAATIERNARAQARLIEELLDVSRITSGNLQLDIQPVSVAAVFETVVVVAQAGGRRALDRGCASDPDDGRRGARRREPAAAGRLEPGVERDQVHARRRPACCSRPRRSERKSCSRSATTASASPPSSCRTCSSASARPSRARRARTAASASAWRSSASWSSCTAARSRRAAPASAAARPSSVRLPLHAVALPVASAPSRRAGAGAAACRGSRSKPTSSGTRILVVDDEADGREMLTRMLESWGAAGARRRVGRGSDRGARAARRPIS